MKTNELECTDLRIGNFLKYNNKIVRVFELHPRYIGFDNEENFVVGDNPEYFQPIELTEEVLLKIGFHEGYNKIFIKNTKNDYVKYYITYQHVPDNKYSFVGYGYKNNVQIKCVILNDIKYLHQLQNACFLLTNQELEIEL